MLVVVTGASKGIGHLLGERLVGKGYHTIGIARSEEALKGLVFVPCHIKATKYPAVAGFGVQV